MLDKDFLVIVENPTNSWLWQIPFYKRLLDRGFADGDFQHCKWSPDDMLPRRKWTRSRSIIKQLYRSVDECCKNTHISSGAKKTDGSFASASEAEYPWGIGVYCS